MLKVAFHDIYKHPLDNSHRFPMVKYELIPEQLLRENTCTPENFSVPGKINVNDILAAHKKIYLD